MVIDEGRRVAEECHAVMNLAENPESDDQFQASDLDNKFPPPPNLTPYIIKDNNQCYAAGGFGDVYRCWCHDGSPKEVAVKSLRFKFSIDSDPDDAPTKMIRRELGIWKRLDHVNIVPFLGIAYGFGVWNSMSLVSLWMQNGSLHGFLAKHGDMLTVVHRLQLLLDISNGLGYLHSKHIIHGDLNPNNVLLDADCNARLADFGYSSVVGNIPEALCYLQRSTTQPGALRWSAPELIDPKGDYIRTTKSDIYSFGCISLQERLSRVENWFLLTSLQILSGRPPWSEIREDMAVILNLWKGEKPGRPSFDISDLHWDFIQHCWSSVEGRPNAKEVIHTVRQFLNDCTESPPLRLSMSSPPWLHGATENSAIHSDTQHILEIVQKQTTNGPTSETTTTTELFYTAEQEHLTLSKGPCLQTGKLEPHHPIPKVEQYSEDESRRPVMLPPSSEMHGEPTLIEDSPRIEEMRGLEDDRGLSKPATEQLKHSAVLEANEFALVEKERVCPVGPTPMESCNASNLNASYAKIGSTESSHVKHAGDIADRPELDPMMLIRAKIISLVPWLAPKKPKTPSMATQPQPLPHIAEAFRQFIRNDIPVRLIDSTHLKFVERDAIFDVFSSEIAQVTEEDVQKQMHTVRLELDARSESGNYISLRKTALREIIRNIVRYAIFSHRWTDSEPSFRDVLAPPERIRYGKQRGIRTAGLAKLAQLCNTARKLGYRLVWSDTCCIDKENSYELGETIPAMFKWYTHAHLCIVYLGASSSLSDFGHEPWFKRGWTLQELLAPRRIKFYDQAWRPLTGLANDKGDPVLMNNVSAATGIPQGIITADNSRGIKGHAVWEIMSWASLRETTRIEDATYCLFGLFDINLPIAYGEGERAFPRLVEAIVAWSHTWDVFAWAGQASERHPALPSTPACYPKWEEAMTSGEVGMTEFALTPHGLRLASIPLIPMAFVSEAKGGDGSFIVTLRPWSSDAAMLQQLGVFSDVRVICGSDQLPLLRDATDLHICILNYKPNSNRHARQGALQVGRKYVCFLLHTKNRNANLESTWLKFATDNVLYVIYEGGPSDRVNAKYAPQTEHEMYNLPLNMTFIRVPSPRSTLWA